MIRTFIEVPLFTKRWKEIGLNDDDLITGIDKSSCHQVQTFRTANGNKDFRLGIVGYAVSSLKIFDNSDT